MKTINQSEAQNLNSKNTEIQIQSIQSDRQWASRNRSNHTKNYILIIVGIIALFIYMAINLSNHQKQQSRNWNILIEKFQQQEKYNQQVKNLLQKSRNQHTKMIARLPRKSQIPKRNFKQATTQDFSSFYCLKKPLVANHLPPKGQRDFLINTRYGFQIYGDAFTGQGEAMTNTIMKEGTFEPETIALMGRLLRPGFNMLNLGVHTGLEAMVAANIVGENGHLYLFQPSNFSNMLIRKSFQLNKFAERATIYKVALSDKKKKSRLFINQDNTGANMLVKDSMKLRQNQYEEVQLDLVDNLVPNDIQIDFALVDVERHQVQVFLGMREVIERSPYLVIMVQWAYGWNPNKNVSKTLEIINFFLELGYSFYRYQGFDPNSCMTGTYKAFQDPLNELLQVGFQNLLIAPSTVILP